MKTETFRNRDYLTLLDYSREEVETILDLAFELKRKRAVGEKHHLLEDKTLFLIFYNQSLRTRNSFEAGMTQLGGHAHFLDPSKIYMPAMEGREVAYSTERISDVARTLARMGEGIAIRCYGDPVDWEYGGAHGMIQEFARWSHVPVINMECDKYHPCQAMADLMTVKEKLGFQGTKFTMSWAYSPSVHKPRAVPQSAIIAAAKVGMEVTLAHPEGMDLDPEVLGACEQMASQAGGSFRVTHDFEDGLKGAHVVYPKAWCATPIFKSPVGKSDPKETQRIFDSHKDWICDRAHMELADKQAIYMHCLPCDRGFEVTDEVIDGPQSAAFDEAENRLHAQKAVMALVMR
ncbi:MAG: N-acetylornithine carbamoyltransferase [Deltaproteobacteria bacterium]|nr:N-acetylornithine carbamoyltransferase [Deltaproteobacteria bacterium]